MALVKCPDCGRDVSTRAEACPNCGCPSKYFPGRASTLGVGDTFNFGRWGGQEIEWRVLELLDGLALLIAKQGIDCKPYHYTRTSATWADSLLRLWLNAEFLQGAFDDAERAKIIQTRVANPDDPKGGGTEGTATVDKLFCLSTGEALRYFGSDADRVCYPTPHAKARGVWTDNAGACRWWLRSPRSFGITAQYVDVDGRIDMDGVGITRTTLCVRPAMYLRLSPDLRSIEQEQP